MVRELTRRKRDLRQLVATFGLTILSLTSPAQAKRIDQAQSCVTAARIASEATDVPFAVLMAVSLTETSRPGATPPAPWPWTVNMEGTGHWFDDKDSAKAYAYRHYKAGARSFDVGCFQINFKWHGHAFASLDAMFDPDVNAQYAARFLTELYQETGDWSLAAGAYHSRTPKYANRYRKIFDAHFARLERNPVAPHSQRIGTGEGQPNAYPLLQGGQPRGLGSLVPTSTTNARRLLVPRARGGF